MKSVRYFDAPELSTAFKVTTGCCVERVVYAGPEVQIGINAINDNAGNDLNSDNYWCTECGVPFKMVQISGHDYIKKYSYVCQLLSRRSGIA